MYKIPASPASFELVEKRSRFITYCEHIQNEDQFKDLLQRLKLQYPDARHFCYGFRFGPTSSARRGFSDDGEPSGTAGMPILNVIDHSEYSDLAIIVVRYFGGTKLGTGGLARAYSQATKAVLETARWVEFEAQQEIALRCQFSQEHQVRYLVSQLQGEIISSDYKLEVILKVKLAEKADLSSLSLYRINVSNDGIR